MLTNNRIIWKNNTTLTDLSVKLNDYHTGAETVDIVAADDALYIGSDLPFNHRYIEISSANAVTASITVKIWDGSEFVSAVDVIDQTAVSGKTFAQSGIISWVPDRNETWAREDTSEDIADLSTLKIYKMYWVKLTFSANLTATTALSYVGHRFSNDEDLGSLYPELALSSTMTQFESGKTTWNEQHVAAAEKIINDLRKKNIIWSRNQILNWELFSFASVHQLARIIFNAFGEPFQEKRLQADRDYKEAFEMLQFDTDLDEDGKLDTHEKIQRVGFVRR